MLASDMAILTAATGHITRAGTTAGDRGVSEELIGAIAGWKKIAAWPTDIRMGGPRARDYISASRELRSYVSADLRGRALTPGLGHVESSSCWRKRDDQDYGQEELLR